MADPFSFPDPFTSFGGGLARRQAAFPPLEDADTDTAVRRLTSGALSGLGYVGSVQDKFGGRAIRGLLGGNPRDLLSVIPFSDSLGITDPTNIVSGEDLAGAAGYADVFGHLPGEGNWLERNLVGPAIEVGLDPTTYLGGIGALTKAGKAAKMNNTLTKGFLPAVHAGQRRLLPVPGLTGPAVADAAGWVGSGLGKVGSGVLDLAEKVPLAGVGVRVARDKGIPQLKSMFHYPSGPVPLRPIQETHAGVFLPEKEAGDVVVRGTAARLQNVQQQMLDAGADKDELRRIMVQQLETPEHRWDAAPTVAPHSALLGQLVGELRSGFDDALTSEQALGLPTKQWRSNWGVDYAARQAMSAARGQRAPKTAKLLPTTNASNKRRLLPLDVPGGTMQLEDWMQDPALTGAARTMKPKQVADFLQAEILKTAGAGPGGIPLAPDVLETALPKQARQLAGWLGKRKVLEPGQSFFVPDVIKMAETRGLRGSQAKAAAKAFYDVVKKTVIPGAGVPLPKAMGRARLEGLPAFEHAARAVGLDPAKVTAGAADDAEKLKVLRDALKGYGLPPDISAGATGFLDRYNPAHELKDPRKWGDSLLNLTKSWLYPTWLASHVRNYGGGVFENAMEGTMPWSPAYRDWQKVMGGQGIESGIPSIAKMPSGYLDVPGEVWRPNPGPFSEAVDMLPGGFDPNFNPVGRGLGHTPYAGEMPVLTAEGLPVASKGQIGLPPTPQSQRLRLIEEMYGQGHIGRPQGELLQRVGLPELSIGSGNPSIPRGTGSMLGDAKQILGNIRTDLKTPAGRDLLGVAGVGDRLEDTNAFVKAGRAVGTNVEDRLRGAQYLDLRRKGYTPEAATAAVRKAHFDYSRLTDFEKEWMKRLVPFYSFSRFNIPKQFQRAAESPAKVGIPMRLTGGGEDQGYVPEYLRSGMALPVGEEVDGTQRYLSQLGLPFEEAFNRLKIGNSIPDTLMKTGQGLLSTLRGEVQNPLEFVTGKDFFTGRDLQDLHVGKVESLGGLLPHDAAALVSEGVQGLPPARFVSTLNRLLDERKWAGGVGPGLAAQSLGLLTGAKLTDVDTQKWRAIDARHQLEQMLQADQRIKESTDYYLPRELRAGATPEEQFMLRLQASLKQRAKEAVEKQRRVGVQVGG